VVTAYPGSCMVKLTGRADSHFTIMPQVTLLIHISVDSDCIVYLLRGHIKQANTETH